MNPLRIAFQFLTRLPITAKTFSEADQRTSVYWYGVVGLTIGAMLFFVAFVFEQWAPAIPLVVPAAAILVLWVGLSGALHLDGLADSADAWLGGHDADRALEIMKDPRSGPAGVTVIVLVLILKFSLVQALLFEDPKTLVVVPALARGLMPVLFRFTPYVRPGGLGKHFASGLSAAWVVLQFAVLTALTVALLGRFAIGPLAGVAVAYLATRRLMTKRLGGTTGDTAGAMIELAEVAALLGAICYTA